MISSVSFRPKLIQKYSCTKGSYTKILLECMQSIKLDLSEKCPLSYLAHFENVFTELLLIIIIVIE